MSRLDRLKACGRRRIDVSGQVAVSYDDTTGVAGYRGLQSCGSIHGCAVCAGKIRAARALEVEAAVTAHLRAGGGAYFVTLTVPHALRQALAELWDAVAGSWRDVQQSRSWRRLSRRHGLDLGGAALRFGLIRSLEVTHGEHGWHPHLHVLVLVDVPLAAAELDELTEAVTASWQAAVVERGVSRPSRSHGVTVSAVNGGGDALARYLVKVQDDGAGVARSLGNELTRHDLKAGRRKGRTPFQVLADVAELGDVADVELWREWESVSRGRQAITWGAGLKQRFAVVETTDEDEAAVVEAGVVVLAVDHDQWKAVQRHSGAMALLLRSVEDHHGDPADALELLRYVTALDPPRQRSYGPPGAPAGAARG